MANFVVARALARVDAAALEAVCADVDGIGVMRILSEFVAYHRGGGLLIRWWFSEANRAGVVKALIERAAGLKDDGPQKALAHVC